MEIVTRGSSIRVEHVEEFFSMNYFHSGYSFTGAEIIRKDIHKYIKR